VYISNNQRGLSYDNVVDAVVDAGAERSGYVVAETCVDGGNAVEIRLTLPSSSSYQLGVFADWLHAQTYDGLLTTKQFIAYVLIATAGNLPEIFFLIVSKGAQ